MSCAETRNEVPAADASAFFESFEDVVDGAETAGDVFGGDGFARKHAVAIEQLKSKGMTGFGPCRGVSR